MKGLYVHIPFCIKKCAYCDFNSFAAEDSQKEEYIDAAISEMSEYKNTKVDTVYIGGGTPTLLSSALLKKLIEGIKENFDLSHDTEFTVEPENGGRGKAQNAFKYGRKPPFHRRSVLLR